MIALSLAAQAWPPSNEAPRPVMRPSAWILFDILSVGRASAWLARPPWVGPKKAISLEWMRSAPIRLNARFERSSSIASDDGLSDLPLPAD